MAKKTFVVLTDDIDGSEIEDGKGGTVSFGLEGRNYEIDLSDKNADKLRGLFKDYISVARVVGTKTGTAGKRTQIGPAAKDVRAWAQANGHTVPERGRIPQEVRDAYDAAH